MSADAKTVVDEIAYAPQARRLTRIQAMPTRPVAKPKPKAAHDYSTLQIDLPHPVATHIRNFAGMIPDDELASDGREDSPHVTLKYGLKTDNPDDVRAVFENEPPISLRFGKTSLFLASETGAEHDVVKTTVYSGALKRLNIAVSDAVDHVDTFKSYKPHATIAYVKPGTGKKYKGDKFLKGHTVEANYVTFISRTGEKTDISLTGTKAMNNVEYKYRPLSEFKMSDDGNGTLEGYSNVSGEIDDGADIVTGYDALDEWKQAGWMAHSHDWSINGMIGIPLDAKVDLKGLWVRAAFHSTKDAQDVRLKAKERMDAGKDVGLSIGYAPSGEVKYLYPADYERELPKYVSTDRLQVNLAKARQFPRVRVLRVAMKEFSIVTSPMNKLANAAEVKMDTIEDKGAHGAPKFGFAPRDRAWDSTAAEKRVREKTGAADAPNAAYSKCFLWSDSEASDKFGSYKFLICDVVDSELKIIPRAVFATAGVLSGSRGGTSIPEADQAKMKSTVAGLYKKMAKEFEDDSLVAPWEKAQSGHDYKDEFTEALVEQDAREELWNLTYVLCDASRDLLDDVEEGEIEDPETEIRSMLAAFGDLFLAALMTAVNAILAGEQAEGPKPAMGKAIHNGLRLRDQFDQALKTADALLARFKGYKEMCEVKDGREVSAANREKMRAMMGRMKDIIDHAQASHDTMKQLCDASEMPKSEAESIITGNDLMRILKIRTETAAML